MKDAWRSFLFKVMDKMDEQVPSGQEGSTKQAKTLVLKAVLENVPQAIECAAQSARAAGFDERGVYEIQLAVDEACANVVNHAYRDMEPGNMEISCFPDERSLTIRVRDWGKGFDPDCVAEPDVDAPLEERSLGGLGLFLVKQVMDDVRFTFDAELGNELSMVKRLCLAE